MKMLLAVAAALEAGTGLALIIRAQTVAWLLIGSDIDAAAVVLGRVAGFALLSLGLACWPGRETAAALRALLTYNLLGALYLFYLAIGGEWAGVLLWPAAATHAILTALLGRVLWKTSSPKAARRSA